MEAISPPAIRLGRLAASTNNDTWGSWIRDGDYSESVGAPP